MSQRDSGFRNISNTHFGDNATINLGDVHNYASDQESQCLTDLRSTDPRHDKLRIQDTKGGLLKDSYRWILESEDFKDWRDSAQNRILWIKGNPGKGKTMLLCGIIDELAPMTKLAKSADPTMNTIFLSYFFCQGSNARINNATAVLRGLIYLLIVQEPSLISHVQGKYKHAGEDLFSDENAWVALSEIFVAILHDSKVEEVILVIDALDECETDLSKLLDTIVRQFTFSPIKCIISSRNVLHIQQMLEAYIPRGILSLELKGNAACVSEAVDAYIKDRVSRLRSIQNDQGRQDELCKKIQEKAQGTFLWASLVVSKIEQVQVWEIMKVVEKMPMGLTALYKRMVDQIDNLEEENGDLCRNMLSTMITAYNPPSLAEVGVLAGLPDQISENSEWIEALVTMCGSFLTLNEGHVYFIHQSAKDFLSTEIHSADAARRHLDVFERSVAAISRLPKNIYGLTDFGVRPKDAQPPEPNPLDSMRYSCFYWANHLCDACAANTKNEAQVIITETLEPLLKSYFLRWIESLSLLGGLTVGLHSIRKLLHELPHDANTQLARFLSNLETFVLRNGVIIAQAPLQVYGTALIFSPLHDDIKASLWNERLSFIKDIRGIRKSAFLQTLKGHYRGAVGALAFSCNSAMLAIKARSGQLHCWEVATGVLKWMIPYYDVGPSAIVFSPDNRTLLLAACRDPIQESTRKNPREKGGENISYWITYIALSPDNGMPETSCSSRKIRLEEPAPNHQDDGLVFSFAFSLDCNTLAAGWRSGSITLWDTTTGLLRQTIQGHEGETQDIAVSPDGGKIVSRSYDEIRLWDATTGDLLNEFEKFEGEILFLSDGMRIQMGSRIYDMTTGTVQSCIDNYASKIAISPDDKILAVVGGDVHLLDATMGLQEEDKSDSYYRLFALSPDGKTAACAKPNAIQLRYTATGECWRTIEDSWTDGIAQQEVTALQNVKKDDRRSEYTAMEFAADGKLLALSSASCLKTEERLPLEPLSSQIQIWDLMSGECTYRKTLRRGLTQVEALAFSPDGNMLAVGLTCKIFLLDTATDMYLWEAAPRGFSVPRSFTFFPDDGMLATVYNVSIPYMYEGHNHEIEIWDIATGKLRRRFVTNIPDRETYSSPMYLLDGRHLRIDHWGKVRLFQKGERPLSPGANLLKSKQVEYIPFNNGWISSHGRLLFWIPEEYRTHCTSLVCGNTIVLGHGSGLTFVWLDL